MAKYETINYTCDRCGKKMKKVDRVLTFTKDISDLWKPKTLVKANMTYAVNDIEKS